MPELPEVEIVRQSLDKRIKKKSIKKVIIRNRNLRFKIPSNFKNFIENKKIIKGYFACIDPEKVGFKLTAIINLRIKKGTLIDVQASIAKHSRVFGVYDVTGEWDSLILARFKDREEMDKFIKTTLSQKNIERTSTSLVLNTVKEEPRVML